LISEFKCNLSFADATKASDRNLVLAAWGKQQLFKLIKLLLTANEAFVLLKGNVSKDMTAGWLEVSGVLARGKPPYRPLELSGIFCIPDLG
jgi:hypothetical protein